MENANNVTCLTLEGHVELQKYRYTYFMITFTVCVLIVCCNSVVIAVIYTNNHLHEPMYIFIAALLCNALFGATALYPKLLIDLLSERQVTYYHTCLLQAFCIYIYAAAEFTLLSAMAYDRYVSICKPLQYSTLLKIYTLKKLLFVCWFLPCSENSVGIILTSRLPLCKFTLNRIYCENYSVIKLSCGDTSVNNLYGLFVFSVAMFSAAIFIIYSYIRILAVCLRNSKDFRRKALQTCLPFHFHYFFIEFLIIPPLFNPIIYGLKMHEILKRIQMLFSWKNGTRVFFLNFSVQ
uniref:G-protein coupled receptors family 1 profile domain-containing protein n=1 Tax=Pygocentrus nattereri TaxID=42514 RepID=A0A3B4BQT9_PYGNA